MLFCEGTRFTPKKHQVSMQVAESKGLAKLKHHLLPRAKGFWVTVQNLRGTGECPSQVFQHGRQCIQETERGSGTVDFRCVSRLAAAALYDSTLNFRNNEKPTVIGILNGKKYHADLYVR